ncbi:MAG: monovalent cation/H+ antiporter complex subunit F [Pseudomonadota bacterium]
MNILGGFFEGPLAWGASVSGILIAAGIVCSVWRLIKGETLPDRVVALDLLSMQLTALLVVFATAVRKPAYLDAALALALISFLSTVAFARYVERRVRTDAPPAPDPEPAPPPPPEPSAEAAPSADPEPSNA